MRKREKALVTAEGEKTRKREKENLNFSFSEVLEFFLKM